MKAARTLAALTAAAALAFGSAAFAADEYNVSNGLTLTGAPLGLHGVDPVSMFDAEAPRAGDAVHAAAHDGVDYYFATADARRRFEADPEAFLPQFGGFCAYGVFVGKKLDGDVRFADIVDGRLYLFVNAVIFEKYIANKAEVLSVAYDKWPGIRATPVGAL
jgi:YHS domain-containing protein